MSKYIVIENEKYEVYLSSNGMIMIEELLGNSFTNFKKENTGVKTIIVLLTGCLWQKNKLLLDEVGDLFDRMLESGDYKMPDVSQIINDEVERWSSKLKTKEITYDKKKSQTLENT